jgi:hypothetical protein
MSATRMMRVHSNTRMPVFVIGAGTYYRYRLATSGDSSSEFISLVDSFPFYRFQ